MESTFTGTLTTTNSRAGSKPSSRKVTATVTFQGSNPSTVSASPLASQTFPIGSSSSPIDTITSTPGAGTGTLDQDGQMSLTVVVTLSDTASPTNLSSNPESVTFLLSTSGQLTMSGAGSSAQGLPLNAAGIGTVTLVGSAPVPLSSLASAVAGTVVVGLELSGTLNPAPPGPVPSTPTTVPFVVGLEYQKAVALVNAAGLGLMVTDVKTDTDTEWDKVLAQSPAGGSASFRGSVMTISVGIDSQKEAGGSQSGAAR